MSRSRINVEFVCCAPNVTLVLGSHIFTQKVLRNRSKYFVELKYCLSYLEICFRVKILGLHESLAVCFFSQISRKLVRFREEESNRHRANRVPQIVPTTMMRFDGAI